MESLWLSADRVLNIAHRGANRVAPQNTLAAFVKAVELGADGVELDAQLSADGVAVVIHDYELDGTTDGSGPVAAQPLAALKELDAGGWFDPAFAGERIPTLAEVLDRVGQQLLVNIELKVPPGEEDKGLEAAVVSLVERFGLAERVLLSSFNPYALRRARALAPHLPLGLLYGPLPSSWSSRFRAARMRDLNPEAVNPFWLLISRWGVRRAHRRGRRVVAWTVDTANVMHRLVGWGVDAIITNLPDRLHEVLEAQ